MLTEKIEAYMTQLHMWPENGQIVAGVSGGADSVCLLEVLARLRAAHGLQLTVVHVDHGIRPESGEDADFVRTLCERLDVPFVLVKEDVEALAEAERISCEEAGRRVRYRAFADILRARCRQDAAGGCIAVAHNRDDRAETLLFHLLRGTGLEGMGSIRPVRRTEDGLKLVRPLLFAGREEIEAFLREEGIGWRTDRTNAQDIYTRNKIRNRILPYAEREISAGARSHLAQEAELLEQTARFVRAQAEAALEECRVREKDALQAERCADGRDAPPEERYVGGQDSQDPVRCAGDRQGGPAEGGQRREIRLRAALFWEKDPFLQDQMLYLALGRLGTGRDLTAAHVREIKKLFAPECLSGRRVELPVCGVRVFREFGTVRMETADGRDGAGAALFPLRLGKCRVPGLGEVWARLLPGPGAEGAEKSAAGTFFENIPQKTYTKWLAYDKMALNSPTVGFRTRREGDYLTVDDALHRKSLKRYMIEEKIPAGKRAEAVLLADGAHVVWLPGHRISAAYKVTPRTAAILEITVVPEGSGESTSEEDQGRCLKE